MSSGPGRFEALLSHQGTLVHVDHSHRAPAPTGYWPMGWREEQKQEQRWMQDQGNWGQHTINVKAGEVRKVLDNLRWKTKQFDRIQVKGLAGKFSVQFTIDSVSDVRYALWETGNPNSLVVGVNYYWGEDQDEASLYAPNAILKPVLEEAALRLLALPPPKYGQ